MITTNGDNSSDAQWGKSSLRGEIYAVVRWEKKAFNQK